MTTAQQRKNIHRTIACILIVMVTFFGLFLHKILTPRVMSSEELRQQGVITFEQPRLIKAFSLLDQNNQAFGLEQLQGKLSLVFFGFTHCPDICPTTLSDLARVYNELSDENQQKVQIILVSLDPARDTPSNLKSYVEYFNPEFIGLTGEFLEIMRLTNNTNVAFNKVVLDEGYTIDHTSHIVMVNEHGHYSGFIKAPLPVTQLGRMLTSSIIPK